MLEHKQWKKKKKKKKEKKEEKKKKRHGYVAQNAMTYRISIWFIE